MRQSPNPTTGRQISDVDAKPIRWQEVNENGVGTWIDKSREILWNQSSTLFLQGTFFRKNGFLVS